MRIRIIANNPMDDDCSDISNLIGKEFNANQVEENVVFIEGLDLLIFKGEYEIID